MGAGCIACPALPNPSLPQGRSLVGGMMEQLSGKQQLSVQTFTDMVQGQGGEALVQVNCTALHEVS